jgi:hypothetical protein
MLFELLAEKKTSLCYRESNPHSPASCQSLNWYITGSEDIRKRRNCSVKCHDKRLHCSRCHTGPDSAICLFIICPQNFWMSISYGCMPRHLNLKSESKREPVTSLTFTTSMPFNFIIMCAEVLNLKVPGALSLGVKRPGRETYHSPPSCTEVKNAWSYTSTPPIRLLGVVLS